MRSGLVRGVGRFCARSDLDAVVATEDAADDSRRNRGQGRKTDCPQGCPQGKPIRFCRALQTQRAGPNRLCVPFPGVRGGPGGDVRVWRRWVDGGLAKWRADSEHDGNRQHYLPPSILNHLVRAKFRRGRNVLAVRFVSGSNGPSAILALSGPGQLREKLFRSCENVRQNQ